ncbi:MAG: hypothetical protein JXB34_12735 [Bacteroidales bacterium]|nr:hypothetical protein [Bacteroidales bacterium]
MKTIKNILKKKLLLAVSVFFVLLAYIILSQKFFETDPLIAVLQHLFAWYIKLAESAANGLLALTGSNAHIENHKIIFGAFNRYQSTIPQIIENWTNYILFKKWSLAILLTIWLTSIKVVEKIKFSFVFAGVHFLSVLSGLLIISAIGPLAVDPESPSQLNPNTVGALAMITLLVVWVKKHKEGIYRSLETIGIKYRLSDYKINQLIVVFYLFSILKNFIVPYFNFYSYIHFLLGLTKATVALFGYHAEIDGIFLRGGAGNLYMAKWCLGLVTMYVFAAMVYLTGTDKKVKWLYIALGIVFLHILNIVRLAVLFMFIQHNNAALAHNHHGIYNIVFYTIVFILWVIWIEKFVLRTNNKKITNKHRH